MTRIFFYHNAADRIAATAALIGKAFAQKKALLVYAPQAPLAAALDRELWLKPPTGFLPHVRLGSPLAAQTPVLIAEQLDPLMPLPQEERLINLSAEVPPGFARFTSVIEVVGHSDEERQSGRQRVKFYRDRGYEIRYFDLATNH